MITMIMKKYYECKVKLAVYRMAANFIDDRKELLRLAKRLYASLKDTPVEELQKKLIAAVSELAHSQAVKERDAQENKA